MEMIKKGTKVRLVCGDGSGDSDGPTGTVSQLPGERFNNGVGYGFELRSLVVDLDEPEGGFDFWPVDEVEVIS